MISIASSGCDAEFAGHAKRPSPSCPTGWHLPGTSACIVDNTPASGSALATLRSKRFRTVRIRHAYPIHRPCAAGRGVGCSAYGAGLRRAFEANVFFSHPPSLLGILARFAIFCRWKQKVHDPPGSRPAKTRNSVAGLFAGSSLAVHGAPQPWSMDWVMPSSPRSQTEFCGGHK